MTNELVTEGLATEARRGRAAAGLRRVLIALRLRRPSFTDKVDTYRRGTAEERRARRQALRQTGDVERARAHFVHAAQRLSEGGIDTAVKFWPIAYRTGTNRKNRKYGFAEMRGAFLVRTRSASGVETTALPFTITAKPDTITILPNAAELNASSQQNAMTKLFLELSNSPGDATDRAFCERLEDALARAVASGRLIA
ncbi:MAG TPA: hypothetical protein VE397_20745 [Stellaceae bacterium]|jgi:hypothetical protein|nr:hypothetical protein [Stellaceae bacterium]